MIDTVAPPVNAGRFPARPRRLTQVSALVWWTVAVLTVGFAATRIWYRIEVRAESILIVSVVVASFCVIVISGLTAWAGRPDSRIGVLLVAWGMINLTGGVGDYENGVLLLWSYLNTPLIGVVFAHAFLTYPGGRTATRVERAFLIVIYTGVSLWIVSALISDPWWISGCTQETCPPNPVLIRPALAGAWVLWWSQRAAMVGFGLWFAVLMVSRVRRMSWAERHTVMPVAMAAAGGFSAFLLGAILDASMLGPGWWWWVQWWLDRITMFWVPVAMAMGLLASRLARASVADLLVLLPSAPVDVLRSELAELLRDPTLEIAVRADHGYVDLRGRAVAVGDGLDRRAQTDLGEGALLLHDPTVRANDAALFDAAVAAVRLSLENARLAAQVRAQLAEVSRSRSRLVAAAYEERRRLERDLHDGAQQSLLGVGMSLQMARREVPADGPAARLLDEATGQLQDSLAELRALARGLKPAMLVERGLPAALAELARRMPVPVDLDVTPMPRPAAAVELTAYYVVAEALQNVAKHAGATGASVVFRGEGQRLHLVVADNGVGGADARAGTGLRGLADRVAAMNGHMVVQSPPDGGTRVVVDLPYVVDLTGAPGAS